MPKFPVVKAKDIIKVLNKLGYEEIRQKGSHKHFKKPGESGIVTVAYHNFDIKPKTLKSILRQAKLSIEELQNLL